MSLFKKLFLIYSLPLFLSWHELSAQQGLPYWEEIQEFRKQDSIQFPGKGKILFVGSSSFRLWKDMKSDFAGYPVINRGFGGSTLADLIRYREEVIFKYNPAQIVIYCGENDLAGSDTITVRTVVNRFRRLFAMIRERFLDVPIAYVAMKPSPSRKHLMPKYEQANNIIRLFLAKQKNTVFIDVYHAMLGEDGSPLPGIFLDDDLHMNDRGYEIWKRLITPHLLKS